ncbi:hypothetical protein [Streptomyces sp. NPDC048473]|uniref:hypothetical protein n=1 Tax=unclassified Streptomyces TaxID=2593676 RepID=UPI00371EF9E5
MSLPVSAMNLDGEPADAGDGVEVVQVLLTLGQQGDPHVEEDANSLLGIAYPRWRADGCCGLPGPFISTRAAMSLKGTAQFQGHWKHREQALKPAAPPLFGFGQ